MDVGFLLRFAVDVEDAVPEPDRVAGHAGHALGEQPVVLRRPREWGERARNASCGL